MRKKIFLIIGLLTSFIWLPSYGLSEKIQVAASIPPQKYFLNQIGQPYLDIIIMIQPGTNPATYEPKPSQLTALSNIQAYFTIGVPFEDVWLSKFKNANPKLSIIPTHKSIKKQYFSSHKPTKGNTRAQTRKDPHIWLSPPLVRIMAKTILDACINLDPSHTPDYLSNYYQFCKEINKLDSFILKSLSKTGLSARHFMVYHPAWGYFAETYSLKQIPVEKKGREPSPKQLLNLISLAKKLGLNTIFVQPQFSIKSAQIITRDINGHVVKLDPLAEDWTKNLKNSAQSIINSLK